MKRIASLVVVACVGLNGCDALRNKAYKDYAVSDITLREGAAYDALLREVQKSGPGAREALLPAACFNIPVDPALKANCGAHRNATLAVLLLSSEALCVEHRKSIYGNEASANIIAGTFTSLFSGAASVVTHDSVQSLLAALALFSNSERSLVNETVYKTALVSAVDSKIVQIREDKAWDFGSKRAASIDDYPAAEMLQEVVQFHYSCSFMNGLRLALEEGTNERPKQKILRLRESLRTLSADMDAVPEAERNAKRKAQFESLKLRYESISQELQTLEKQ